MDAFVNILTQTLLQVGVTFIHNWPFLIFSILISVLLKLYVDPQKVSAFLIRHRRAGVIGATAAAVGTPLCSCGTTAIILGMIASTMPWAPIIAFMVASPLTSPEELIYSAGLFGWPFAIAFFASSIILGLLGGLVAGIFENRGWLKNQARFNNDTSIRPAAQPALQMASQAAHSQGKMLNRPLTFELSLAAPALAACGCGAVEEPAPVLTPTATVATSTSGCEPVQSKADSCGCGSKPDVTSSTACACENKPEVPASTACGCAESASTAEKPRVTLRLFLREAFTTGKRLLLMFAGFAFIGYFLNNLIPSAWVAAIFGKGNIYSVPLAASLGLPLYINTEGSLPLIRALIDGGMSQGAALAFLITGAGTSFGAVAGALTIARWRVIALVIGTLWVGAVVLGYLYNFLLLSGLI